MSVQYENFGKYILLEKLAMGGMAEVYLAKAPSAGGISKFVAIKRILPQYSENPDFVEMFKGEAKIAINLNHSNVVSIFEFGMEKDQFFLVLDYVEGRNLRQILNKMKKSGQQLSTEQILYVIKEVAAGLDNAHRCLDGATGRPLNIIHRDMSPQNVMVSFEGEVKVIDFGIAKAESQIESTKAGTLKGKFGYMSPEQVDGKAVDLRTDIFSLGTVLWELLANDRLFVANNEMNTLRKIRDCQIPSLRKINPNLPQELDNIVNKALARDRNLRYQTAAALHKDLNRFLNRHYPDFSPQDFSVFIKNLYAAEILETRKKLIEFSKVQADGQFTDDRTEVTATITETGSMPQKKKTQQSSVPEPPNVKVDFNDLNIKKRDLMKKRQIDFQQSNVSGLDLDQRSSSQSFSGTVSGVTSTHTNRTHTNFTSTQHQNLSSKWGGLAKNFVLAALFLGGLYYLFVPQNMENEPESTELSSEMESPALKKKSPEPTTPTFTLMVSSRPSKAQILINGKDSEVQTPGIVRVPQNQAFLLELRKSEYITYRKRFKAIKNGQKTPTITLQRELVGYINIAVSPSTAIIYVNGEKIHQTPPIKGYAIPAGTRISVKAINPFSQTSDETLVIVDREQTKNVVLKLRRQDSGRQPSNRVRRR